MHCGPGALRNNFCGRVTGRAGGDTVGDSTRKTTKGLRFWRNPLFFLGGPNGTRTRVPGVRGRYPGPLDDGTFNIRTRAVCCNPSSLTTSPKKVAGGRGFEPRLTGPEPVVLPLDDPPVESSSLPERSHHVKQKPACQTQFTVLSSNAPGDRVRPLRV